MKKITLREPEKQRAKKMGFSNPTIKRYRNDINIDSPFNSKTTSQTIRKSSQNLL